MRFLPFTLQKAPFCKVKGKKLQAKGFISSVTVDLSYSKSAKKKVLRRDTKQGIQANKKIYCERTRVFIFYFVCAAALTGRVPSLAKETRIESALIEDFPLKKKGQHRIQSPYNLSIVSNSNLISFQTSQAEANSGLHLQAARIMSPPSRARSRPSLRA